jgi:hypothetical protein
VGFVVLADFHSDQDRFYDDFMLSLPYWNTAGS